MNSITESIGDMFAGATEAVRDSLAEMKSNRQGELGSAVLSIDHVTEQAMGLGKYIGPDLAVKSNKGSIGSHEKASASEFNMPAESFKSLPKEVPEEPAPVADLGAFRRRKEALELVDHAHNYPQQTNDNEAKVITPPTNIWNEADLPAENAARLEQARLQVQQMQSDQKVA